MGVGHVGIVHVCIGHVGVGHVSVSHWSQKYKKWKQRISCFIAGHFLFYTGFNEVNLVGQIPSFMLIEIEQTINYPILNFKF